MPEQMAAQGIMAINAERAESQSLALSPSFWHFPKMPIGVTNAPRRVNLSMKNDSRLWVNDAMIVYYFMTTVFTDLNLTMPVDVPRESWFNP